MADAHDSRMAHLVPDKHPQDDFFVLDIRDASPRDDLASMEHPLFALKSGDQAVREYSRNGYTVTVKPGHDGCATIHDKDIWLYCISQLVAAQNDGREISRTVQFTAFEFLKATNRNTDGRAYEQFSDALARLRQTTVETNIATNGYRERRGFGLVDSWRVIERDGDHRMIAVEVSLPDWLYRSVKANQVKAINRDYFRLRKPLDRRIYELARKHCGNQPQWRVGISTLHEKSGSRAKLYEFRRSLKALGESQALPDYRLVIDTATDSVTFYSRGQKGGAAQFRDLARSLKR